MKILHEVQEFIENNIKYIKNKDFKSFYEALHNEGSKTIDDFGKVTDVLLQIGLNPLLYMDAIPTYYLDGSVKEHIVIPNNVKDCQRGAFAYSLIRTFECHDNLEISPCCFFNCVNLEEFILPSLMIELPERCFHNCTNLRYVDLNKVERIENWSLACCPSLKKLYISEYVTYIADNAFESSPNLVLTILKTNDYAIDYAKKKHMRYEVV